MAITTSCITHYKYSVITLKKTRVTNMWTQLFD